jgi:hypothetical protein
VATSGHGSKAQSPLRRNHESAKFGGNLMPKNHHRQPVIFHHCLLTDQSRRLSTENPRLLHGAPLKVFAKAS